MLIKSTRDTYDTTTAFPFTCWDFYNKVTKAGLPCIITGINIVAPGIPRLERIQNNACLFYIEDSLYAQCSVMLNGVAPIYSVETLGVVGACVFGDSPDYLPGGTYTPGFTAFVNAANVLPINTNRVLSFKDSSGVVATGPVKITHGNRVSVKDRDGAIEVSFTVPQPTKAIKYLKLSWEEKAAIVAEVNEDQSVNLTYQGRSLDEICESKSGSQLPGPDGLLKPDVPSNTGTGQGFEGGAEESGEVMISAVDCEGVAVISAVAPTGYKSRLVISKDAENSVKVGLIG